MVAKIQGMAAMNPAPLDTAPNVCTKADVQLWHECQQWWRVIAQITQKDFPVLYELSAPAREWAKQNGYPHAP